MWVMWDGSGARALWDGEWAGGNSGGHSGGKFSRFCALQAQNGASGNSRIAARERQFGRQFWPLFFFFVFLLFFLRAGTGRAAILELPLGSGNSKKLPAGNSQN